MDNPSNIEDILRTLVKPRDTLYFVVRHTTPTSDYCIDVYVIDAAPPLSIGYYVSSVLGLEFDTRKHGIKISREYDEPGAQIALELTNKLYPGEDHVIRYFTL